MPFLGQGTTVTFGAYGPWLVRNITGPGGFECTNVDVTHMGSPGGWRQMISGLPAGSQVTLEIIYDPSTTPLPVGPTATATDLVFAWPTTPARTTTVSALIARFDPSVPRELATATIVFDTTGAPVTT